MTWATTPDARPGRQRAFLRAGHDVYVSDAVERGRAGWARFPEIFPTAPIFRSLAEGWTLVRVGPADGWDPDPAKRRARDGTLFPVAAWDQFGKQAVPRWVTTDAAIQKAYNDLVERVCPCVLMVHSQGGTFGFNAALAALEKVKAPMAIEPSGAPDPARVEAARRRGSGPAGPRRDAQAQAATGLCSTPFSASSAASSPDWNISVTMSQPPTNSPFT